MEEISVNTSLSQQDLFSLFTLQLKKDFESCGIGAEFTENLPNEFEALKSTLIEALQPLMKNNFSSLQNLLYRIDISESQIKNSQTKNPDLNFESVLAELIIKRILQKVILRKRFS